jgi:hypothetical protein
MAGTGERVTVSAQELALANSITLTALIQLMEERGIVKQAEVLQRVREIRDAKKPRGSSPKL